MGGYSSDPGATYSGSFKFRTNSSHKKSIRLKENATIHGDAIVGPGGKPDEVIEMNVTASITGDTYAAAERWEPPPVIVPTDLTSLTAEAYVYEEGEPISGNVRYVEFTIPEGQTQEIVGDVAIYVEGDMKVERDAELIVKAGSSLTLYLGGKLEVMKDLAEDVIKGIKNEAEDPTKLVIYGTDTCDKIKIEENQGVFYGAVYAPHAKVETKNIDNIYGAFVGWNVKLKRKLESGIGNYYYDEALHSVYYDEVMGSDDPVHFVTKTWREE